MVQMPQRRDRSFAAKVGAFNAGYARVRELDFEILGNLDADLSFDVDYFEFILSRFREDANLGVGGTVFKEDGYSSERQSFEGRNHVAGGCQMFRKRCLEGIGGFTPNEAGGVDWMAVTTARMMGWKTESFRERSFFHHRHLGTAERSVALFFVFLRRERLLPRWSSGLGGIPSCLPGCEAAIYHRRPGLRNGILLGFSSPDASPSLTRTHGVPPQRTDGQAQGHSQVPHKIQTSRQFQCGAAINLLWLQSL